MVRLNVRRSNSASVQHLPAGRPSRLENGRREVNRHPAVFSNNVREAPIEFLPKRTVGSSAAEIPLDHCVRLSHGVGDEYCEYASQSLVVWQGHLLWSMADAPWVVLVKGHCQVRCGLDLHRLRAWKHCRLR